MTSPADFGAFPSLLMGGFDYPAGTESGYQSEIDGFDSTRTSAMPSGMPSGSITPSYEEGDYAAFAMNGPHPDHLHAALLQIAKTQDAGLQLKSGVSYMSSSDKGGSDGTPFAAKRSRGRASRLSEQEIKERNRRRLEHNRVSAKQSRERKKMFVAALESHVEQLQQMRETLQAAVQQLSEENRRLREAAGVAATESSPQLADLSAQLGAAPVYMDMAA